MWYRRSGSRDSSLCIVASLSKAPKIFDTGGRYQISSGRLRLVNPMVYRKEGSVPLLLATPMKVYPNLLTLARSSRSRASIRLVMCVPPTVACSCATR